MLPVLYNSYMDNIIATSTDKSTQHLGVLLVNLGTPCKPTAAALRRYLAEFLSDRRVIELPRVLWLPILYGAILPIRPFMVAKKYADIWTQEGAPLLAIAKAQCKHIQAYMDRLNINGSTILAMRYGKPSIRQALAQLKHAGMTHLLVLPLYPQYCAATTGSTFDKVTRELQRYRDIPAFQFVHDYHQNPGYIDALAKSIEQHWRQYTPADQLIFSYHGIPKSYVTAGDPYYTQCEQTTQLVVEKLGLTPDRWQMVFQSRFGANEWLQPYCVEVLEQLGEQKKSVDIICPGFSADCLETLEEISIENCEIYTAAGGHTYRYIPALNTCDDHIQVLGSLIEHHVRHWI